MQASQCSNCGKLSACEHIVPFLVEHGSKTVTIQDRQTFCSSCQNVSYIGSQISEHELAIAAAIRDIDGLLSADDLRRIRAKYRLRQTDLEQMLSVGPKTWTRWERGKIPQSKAADTLIRVISEDPEIARRLMELAGVENAEATSVFEQFEADAKRQISAVLRKEVGLLRNANAENFAERMADKAFETVRDVRRQSAAQAEAA